MKLQINFPNCKQILEEDYFDTDEAEFERQEYAKRKREAENETTTFNQ